MKNTLCVLASFHLVLFVFNGCLQKCVSLNGLLTCLGVVAVDEQILTAFSCLWSIHHWDILPLWWWISCFILGGLSVFALHVWGNIIRYKKVENYCIFLVNWTFVSLFISNNGFYLKVNLCYIVLVNNHTSLPLLSTHVLYSFPFFYFKPFIILVFSASFLIAGSWVFSLPSEHFCLIWRVYFIYICCVNW